MSNKQLFCFTYAGGTRRFFDVIENELRGIDLVTIDYAGHGDRHTEPFYQNFDELADDMFREVKDRLCGEYAFFGYSMGSIALVEVLKRMIRSEMPPPIHVFLAAHEPRTKSELLGFTADELDEWVKERTIQFGGIPERLLKNKVFWRIYLPIYRADYSIINTYKFELLDLKTNIPATIFYSETDTPLAKMKQWERYFSCEFHQFEGTHFFIQQHHTEMAEIIQARMGEIYGI